MTPSWYDVLDVDSGASSAEIRGAWRDGIADLEPGSRRFQTLNQAAEVLLDEAKRAAYDEELAAAVVEQVPEPDPYVSTQGTGPSPVANVERRGVATWLLAALGALAVACVAAAIFTWHSGGGESAEDATRAAQAAAEQAIVPVLSYDYETLEADQKRATSYLTNDYRKDYDELFGVIADNAPSTKTKVTAEVIASGIVRSGSERVDVLIFVDRPTVNKLSAEPVTYKDQVTVTMQKVGDDWLIDNLVTSPVQG